MSCNCNRANPNCEPCAFCTPPGVTNLPVCTPVDICDNSPINIDCVTYSGQDFECLNVQNGNTLISVLLNILNVYFPEEYCCALEGQLQYTTPLTTTTTSTSTTSTTTSTTSTTTTLQPQPACIYYQVTNTNLLDSSTIQYVPCNSQQSIQLQVTTTVSICVNNQYPITVINGTATIQNFGPCSTPGPTTSTTTTTTLPCECGIYTIQNLSNKAATLTYTACEDDDKIFISFTIAPNSTISVCACSNILGNATVSLLITGPSGACTTTPTTSTTTSTSTSTTSTTTSTTSSTTTTTTVAPVCNCYTIENPTTRFLGYQWTDCNESTIENSTVAPETTAYRCSLDTYISVSPGLILTNLGLCSNIDCNPPLEIMIGTSVDDLCAGGGSPITVTGNNPSFCNSTTFYSTAFLLLTPGLYYLYSGGYNVLIEADGINSTLSALSPCTQCTTTTTTGAPTTTTTSTTSTSSTTTTTTSIPFLFGRRATIPVPVEPNPGLVIAYFDTNLLSQTLFIDAQPSPSNYYLCIECGSVITIMSGTPPGTITYDDLGPVDCNCIS
jgi:hypothetical protein